jgi:hypothetical protein
VNKVSGRKEENKDKKTGRKNTRNKKQDVNKKIKTTGQSVAK